MKTLINNKSFSNNMLKKLFIIFMLCITCFSIVNAFEYRNELNLQFEQQDDVIIFDESPQEHIFRKY